MSTPIDISISTLEEPESSQAEQSQQLEIGRGIATLAASDRELLIQGRRAFERGDRDLALENLTRLAQHGNEYADVHYMLGIVHERGGDLDAALASLREAIRINPSYVEALLAMASLQERCGDFERSRSYAERASLLCQASEGELDATTRGKLTNQQAALADALVEAGERRDAIEEYRRALDRSPTFHDIRHRLGITLRDAGLPFQAAQEFRRILRTHPSMLESQIQLGLTYYSMGRTPDAIGEWDAVLEKDPSRDEARMYLRLVSGSMKRSSDAPHTTDVDSQRAAPTQGWRTAPLLDASDHSSDHASEQAVVDPTTPAAESSAGAGKPAPDRIANAGAPGVPEA